MEIDDKKYRQMWDQMKANNIWKWENQGGEMTQEQMNYLVIHGFEHDEDCWHFMYPKAETVGALTWDHPCACMMEAFPSPAHAELYTHLRTIFLDTMTRSTAIGALTDEQKALLKQMNRSQRRKTIKLRKIKYENRQTKHKSTSDLLTNLKPPHEEL